LMLNMNLTICSNFTIESEFVKYRTYGAPRSLGRPFTP